MSIITSTGHVIMSALAFLLQSRRFAFTRVVVPLSLISATLSGCKELPMEPNVNDGYRIFGIQADPPVARPDDQVTFTVYDAHPVRDEMLYSWSVCLYSYGGATGFECVSPEFSTSISNEDSPRLTIDLGPDGLDLRDQMSAFAELPDVDGKLPSLERGHDIYISLYSGLDPSRLTRTIKRLRVIDSSGDEPLATNPKIKGWSIQPNTYGEEACVRKTISTLLGEMTVEEDTEDTEDTNGGEESESPADEVIDSEGEFLEKGRAYILREVTGAGDPCVVRAEASLDVSLDLEAPASPLLYEWLADEAPYANPTWREGTLEEGGVVGRYLMPNRSGQLELYFTVRAENGGFAIGHQTLTLVPNKSTGAR